MWFVKVAALVACATAVSLAEKRASPKSFLTELGNSTWVIGNSIWNVTQGRQYATKLWYKGKDRVGAAVGHYVSYSVYTQSLIR